MTEKDAAKPDPEASAAPGATPPASDDDWERQKLADNETMRKLLDQDSNGQVNILPQEYMNEDYTFDQSGKADDAEDFEDISDDDLPEEEETAGTQTASAELPGLTDDGGTSNDNDDLWGEGEGDGDADLGPSSPLIGAPSSPPPEAADDADADTMDTSPDAKEREDSAPYKPSDFDINFPTADYSLNQDPSIPAVAQTELELVKSVWPTFDTGTQFDWNRLLPPKKATWVGKKPTRAPKPLAPTKLSLDLEVDQEKTFRVPGPAAGTTRQKIRDAEAKGLVSCLVPEPIEEADITIFSRELDDDNETVGGFTLADIETICFDFESMIDAGQPISPPLTPTLNAHGDDEDDWDKMFLDSQPAAKRRKIEVERGLPRIPQFVAPSFDQFEEATARAAKRVHLDFADPHLLIEEQTVKHRKLNNTKAANGRLGRNALSRFNFANDEQYENLKLNHKHKVRATIGNMAVEHSIPAIKLLWPYYSVKPEAIQPYDYHRPLLQTNKGAGDWVRFSQPTKRKRKIEKNRKVQETFSSSKDLTLNDNSYVVLFEYSEQIPTVLSKFGMGNKIVNHARKRINTEDESSVVDKKVYELGEENILTTEDKSPFSTFGRVEQGEVVPTLTNAMYHAPIFKHQPRKTDFILGRSTTGKEGPFYYLRKIDHLYVVGQNFPSMEVPGPHSRKVTTLSKNRMKMIAYRLIHSKGAVELPEMTKHVKGSTDPQNRQKLKEFLSYDKNIKAWKIKESDTLLDKDSIDKMIKPEDVCLNDAHQVGAGELLINGYTVSKVEENDHDLDDGNEQSFAKSMSPWNTTKAFIDACAGKAMVRLRGPGDPTGHGLGFSFIKTSMKGGYMEALQKDRGPGNTANDAMTIEAQRKDANGHSYNVKQQEELYNKEIGEIWTKQKMTLSDPMEHDDEDMQKMDDEDDRFYGNGNASANASFAQSGNFGGSQAPASSIMPPTPGGIGGSTVIDDKTSVFSRRSATEIGGASGVGGGRKKMLKIYRRIADGSEETVEMVFDEKVMKRYIDQRREARSNEIDVFSENIGFTNDEEYNAAMIQRINQEQARLIRNKERRLQREKSKSKLGPSVAAARASTPSGGPNDPDSPAPSIEKGAGAPAGGTSRKCANCGQVGHIKTNKKLCPLLNGTWTKESGGHEEAGGFNDA
ncbi:hypothetical protein MCOR01_010638 [Pyricularia oryzae]|nr:hypothetical protein MCOR01_010638 [Pyricularia oryzae]